MVALLASRGLWSSIGSVSRRTHSERAVRARPEPQVPPREVEREVEQEVGWPHPAAHDHRLDRAGGLAGCPAGCHRRRRAKRGSTTPHSPTLTHRAGRLDAVIRSEPARRVPARAQHQQDVRRPVAANVERKVVVDRTAPQHALDRRRVDEIRTDSASLTACVRGAPWQGPWHGNCLDGADVTPPRRRPQTADQGERDSSTRVRQQVPLSKTIVGKLTVGSNPTPSAM